MANRNVRQVSPAKLRKLVELARDVAYEAETASPFKLSAKQCDAIDDALRMLDAANAYSTGDKLRIAFGIELDTVKHNMKRFGYGEDC